MTNTFWPGKRVMVTGGSGFVGSFVVDALHARGAAHVFVPRSARYDLRDRAATQRALADAQPDVVLHLAATVGGIGANRVHPATYIYDNLMMNTHVIHESWRAGVQKLLVVGTVCSYPKHAPIPFREETLFDGYPEETNAPYGEAKRAALVMGQSYRAQHGFDVIHVLPTNTYGPRDDFDGVRSHVIPDLMRKLVAAKADDAPSVTVWGTGSASREFLYVEDAAEGILLAAEHYSDPAPVNLGSGQEILIRDLVPLLASLVGYTGQIVWDASKPDGQPRRCLDTTRATAAFGFSAHTPLEEGLRRTLAWYTSQPQLMLEA